MKLHVGRSWEFSWETIKVLINLSLATEIFFHSGKGDSSAEI
jgi:hypothetical protein